LIDLVSFHHGWGRGLIQVHLCDGRCQVRSIRDVVAIEDRAGLVTGNLHGDLLWDATLVGFLD
jgi:hypothetical protein